MNYLPQEPLPPILVIKEIEKLYDNVIESFSKKTWLERLFMGDDE